MFRFRQATRRTGTTVWQMLFCLTFLSFLCRAVVPVGYMPDISAGRDGGFALTFCTPGGSLAVQKLDLTDQEKASTDNAVAGQDCPFGMATSQALLPAQEAPVLARAVLHRPLVLLHDNKALPPLPALGPPLGPRAPPLNLG